MPSDGRLLSPFDNEALSRYFSALSTLSPEEEERVVAEFDLAITEGCRPLVAVKRALNVLRK